jgi:Chagasin family peptidase inhibitor I42
VTEVRLRVCDHHPVRLPGLGTAGYRWTPEVGGDDGVAEVSAEGPAPTGSDVPGSSRDELFTIHARRPGVARVRFVQRRRWESPDVAPANEHVVELRVDG